MSKKTDYFGELNSATLLRFGLDSQIYDTDIATPLGLTKTSPAGSKDVVPASLKVGFATGKFIKLKARCERGAAGFEKTRIVPLICEVAKVNSAVGTLVGKTVNLGNTGSGQAWTIKGFVG
jgi:hypothetical protein